MKKETQPILYTYDSGIPGPTVVISAGVHGDEIGGVMALEYAQENFTIKKGVVHYLVVNPPAIEEGRRLININRICARDISGETYEYRNAAIIMNLLDTADMLLDLHAFSDPLGDAFVITVTRDVGKVHMLPYNRIVSGLHNHARGSLDAYMHDQNKIGITVELGWLAEYEACKEKGIESIRSFLQHHGMMVGESNNYDQMHYFAYDIHIKKDASFAFEGTYKNFDEIKKDALIAMDGSSEVRADRDMAIIFPFVDTPIGSETFFYTEKRALG